MTLIKERKFTVEFLILLVIKIISFIIKINLYNTPNIELFVNADIYNTISAISIFILVLCFLKPKFKKPLLFVFLVLEVYPNILELCNWLVDSYNLSKAVLEIFFPFFYNVFPFLLMMLTLCLNNKILEWICFVTQIFLLIVSVFITIEEIGTSLFLSLAIYAFEIAILLYLWYKQIFRHISFKKKVTFDYNSIQKKMTVSETNLEELKTMHDNGTISEEEYNRKKSEIISNL